MGPFLCVAYRIFIVHILRKHANRHVYEFTENHRFARKSSLVKVRHFKSVGLGLSLLARMTHLAAVLFKRKIGPIKALLSKNKTFKFSTA